MRLLHNILLFFPNADHGQYLHWELLLLRRQSYIFHFEKCTLLHTLRLQLPFLSTPYPRFRQGRTIAGKWLSLPAFFGPNCPALLKLRHANLQYVPTLLSLILVSLDWFQDRLFFHRG